MTLAVRLPELFPPLATLALAARAGAAGGVFVVGDAFGYTRTQRASRMRVRTADGWTWASAPLVAASLGQRLDTVALAPPRTWAPRLARTLQHAYGQSPFFAHYGPDACALLAAPHASAAALALASTAWLFARFGLAAPVAASSLVPAASASTSGDSAALTLDALCAATGATRLLSLSDTAARDERVRPVEVVEAAERPRRQMFEDAAGVAGGFVGGLSALDALFLYGPAARQWIEAPQR